MLLSQALEVWNAGYQTFSKAVEAVEYLWMQPDNFSFKKSALKTRIRICNFVLV
jgi:hypothetical protein